MKDLSVSCGVIVEILFDYLTKHFFKSERSYLKKKYFAELSIYNTEQTFCIDLKLYRLKIMQIAILNLEQPPLEQ